MDACCWFESISAEIVDRVGADNIIFETDFPHPTSIFGADVRKTIERGLASLSDDVRPRVHWSNARTLYEIEEPGSFRA